MNRKGFTLVEIMIVVAIIALLASIAIPNLLRAKVSANDAAAQSALKSLSTACETYATGHDGADPGDEASLTNATPPYMNKAYDGNLVNGFNYDLSGLSSAGYTISATPLDIGTSGTTTFIVTTGGVLTPD